MLSLIIGGHGFLHLLLTFRFLNNISNLIINCLYILLLINTVGKQKLENLTHSKRLFFFLVSTSFVFTIRGHGYQYRYLKFVFVLQVLGFYIKVYSVHFNLKRLKILLKNCVLKNTFLKIGDLYPFGLGFISFKVFQYIFVDADIINILVFFIDLLFYEHILQLYTHI